MTFRGFAASGHNEIMCAKVTDHFKAVERPLKCYSETQRIRYATNSGGKPLAEKQVVAPMQWRITTPQINKSSNNFRRDVSYRHPVGAGKA